MRVWLAFCLALFIATASAAEAPPAAGSLSGEVLEVKDVTNYTYLRLKVAGGEVWAAVGTAAVKVGEQVTLVNVMTLNNFNSKSLNRTFDTIVFGSLAGAGAQQADLATPHGAQAADDGKIQMSRAAGANAYTVEEIVTRAASLKDKSVLLRAKVVKFNPAIMGRNWLHLRDGTGSEAAGSNDILVTTASGAEAGAVVTVSGKVRTGKDFGAGYAYKVMIEDAKLLP